MNIPNTPLSWVPAVTGQDHGSILTLIQERPIVAWFSSQKKCVHTLRKAPGRLGDNAWCVQGHNYDEEREVDVTVGFTTLAHALRYLTEANGWTLCEFADGREFHHATLAYLES